MTLPVITNVFRCGIEQTLGDQPIANVIHVQTQADEDASTIADAVAKAWGVEGGFTEVQTSDLHLNNVHVTKLDGISLTQDSDFSGANHQTGQEAGNSVPSNVALVASLQTGARGRSHRGRIYLAAISIAFVQSPAAHWSGGFLTGMQAKWLAFTGELEAQLIGLAPVVASYKLADAFPITQVVFRSDFGTQRMRARV